jgi:CheY-like chemotaxis protein
LHALAFLIPIPQEVPHEIAALNIPVIQLPLPHTGQLAEYMGVFAYLVKPLRRSELLEALARLSAPPQRLLLIDDDVHFIRLLRRYLRDTPWNGSPTVVAAHSLSEAQLMLSEPFDLILLDLLLPDGIGTELLTQLRQNDQLKNRPVIIISAHEGIREDLPLKGILSLSRATGIRLEELLRLLEAILAAVDPSERYLRERSAESLMTEETRGRGE